MQTKTTSAQALDEVGRWRFERLVESGFALTLAAGVAKSAHYDLHELIEPIERGCQPELAVRILAPVEEETAA